MKHKSFLIIIALLMLSSAFWAQSLGINVPDTGNPRDYVSLGTNNYNTYLSGSSAITIEAWIDPTTLTVARNRIFTIPMAVSPTARVGLLLGLTNNGSVEVGGRSDNSATYYNLVTPVGAVTTAGGWFHVAGVLDFTLKTIKIYINGSLVSQNLSAAFPLNTYQPGPGGPEYMGMSPFSVNADPYFGYMDEVRLWNVARTQAEIQAMMNYTIPGAYPGLIGNWTMDENTGITANDLSGLNKDGTITGAAWSAGKPGLITLPVELSSFTATITSQHFVQLQWITQSETDALGFMIFRSETNNLVQAYQASPLIEATNTSIQTSYSYTDDEVSPGTWYYWLQSVELNGNHYFHGPILATVAPDQGGEAPEIPGTTGIDKVYPNPFNPTLTIQYGVREPLPVSFRIYNTRGQMVQSYQMGTLQPGSYKLVWDADQLAAGIYVIQMKAGDVVSQSKTVLSK